MSHVTCHMSNAYVDRWDMLNNFCFHLYAQKSLFIAKNCNGFFLTSAAAAPDPLTIEFIELVPSFCLTFRHFLCPLACNNCNNMRNVTCKM